MLIIFGTDNRHLILTYLRLPFWIRDKTGNQLRFVYWQSEQRLAHRRPNRLIKHNVNHENFLLI